MTLVPSDHSAVLNSLLAALDWLESLGVPARKGRHAHYARILDRIVGGRADGSIERLVSERVTTETAIALIEADQLARIWRGFRNDDSVGLREKLQKFVKGPRAPGDESPTSNRARNFGFELDSAASLSAAGCEVIWRTAADVDVFSRGVRYVMECKRPLSRTSFEDNLKEAVKQLVQRLNVSPVASYGLVAFSVGRMNWPSGVVVLGESPASIWKTVLGWTQEFDRDHARRLLGHDPRIVGALIDAPFLGHISGTSQWFLGHAPAILAVCPQQSVEFAHVMAIGDRMRSGHDLVAGMTDSLPLV
jgi:hypothetical protein